jgi:hypothetical protein
MYIKQVLLEVWKSHNYLWWTGQVIAMLLAMALAWHGYGGSVAAAVGYALAVLVDIREAASRGASDAQRCQ